MGSPIEDTILFEDPLSDKLYHLMKGRAASNTDLYRKIFKACPDDVYKTFKDCDPNHHIEEDELKKNYEEHKGKIEGNIVEFPTKFLENENLDTSYFCKEQLVPIKTFI